MCPSVFVRLAGVCLGAASATLACGGGSVAAGTGGTSPGSGGATTGSGGLTSSGGSSPGGAPGAGGSSPGTGGADAGWEEVRCWQYSDQPSRLCYGRLGNLWATVGPMCAVDVAAKDPMDLNSTACAGEDDPAGWDETWCDEEQCYGCLGDWATVLTVECSLYPYPSTELEGTPSEVFCDQEETPTGWDFLGCLVSDGVPQQTFCYGSHGLYAPKWGLVPTCNVAPVSPNYVEVPPDPEYCPEPP